MTKWQEVRLGDVCDVKGGKRLPKGVNLVTIKNTHPYIRVRDLGQGKRLQLNQNYEYVDDETQKIISHYIVSEDDVLISIVGTIGLIGIVGNSLNNANLTENCVKLINLRGIDKDFLYYFLISNSGQDAIKQGTVGAVQAKLPIKNIQTIQILLPPLDVQKKIAGVLGALDDKIELNNRINNNLEQQAQALFKSWFVDFEPFGGTMPKDWKESDIYSISNIIYGAPFASKLFNTEKKGLPIIRIRDLKNQHSDTYTEEIHPKAYIIKAGDIVVGMDGEFRPYIWGNDEGLLNQRVCVFENKRSLGKMFLYLTIKPLLNRVEQTEVATTVIHIGKQDFDAFRFSMPSNSILDKFDAVTQPIYNKIVSNSLENTRLASLRDALLPKLMSGEIDVSNVDISALTSADKLSFNKD